MNILNIYNTETLLENYKYSFDLLPKMLTYFHSRNVIQLQIYFPKIKTQTYIEN